MIRHCFLALALLGLVAAAPAAIVALQPVDSEGRPQRWLDAADRPYAATFRDTFRYADSRVLVAYDDVAPEFRGLLLATGLKPNSAYQIKLVGRDGTPSNERLGAVGRRWQEEWSAAGWGNGENLNVKGNGSRPSPNDRLWEARRVVLDPASPTGRRYRFRGYLLFAHVMTALDGTARCEFAAHSSYHALVLPSQLPRTPLDGPLLRYRLLADPTLQPAYARAAPPVDLELYAEWERLPLGGIRLPPGEWELDLRLSEESFHGKLPESGDWATVLGAPVKFRIEAPAETQR